MTAGSSDTQVCIVGDFYALQNNVPVPTGFAAVGRWFCPRLSSAGFGVRLDRSGMITAKVLLWLASPRSMEVLPSEDLRLRRSVRSGFQPVRGSCSVVDYPEWISSCYCDGGSSAAAGSIGGASPPGSCGTKDYTPTRGDRTVDAWRWLPVSSIVAREIFLSTTLRVIRPVVGCSQFPVLGPVPVAFLR